jgi:hypothetical protein
VGLGPDTIEYGVVEEKEMDADVVRFPGGMEFRPSRSSLSSN